MRASSTALVGHSFSGPSWASQIWLLRSPGVRATIIRPPKPGGLRIFLGTKPAIRLGQGRIVAAPLHLVDADIASDARAYGKLGLDAAPGRHGGMIGE